LTRVKERNGLKEQKCHSEAVSADIEVVNREWQQVQEVIKTYGYKLRDIINMDETGIFYGHIP
jgi:cupin superfamily acireductone dioxygenase involved in methionine salvage